ncbi:MAG: DUF4167 domain-containing protein [Rhodospirillaceae bacterium]|nr:DUF4167 domain-containing protein [Rhodospirillaceae bacterium]MBL6930610.1 DUF4167 domain-containing protein [Rhodospirillales bacterium]
MKQSTNPRRGRGRNNGKRNPNQNSRGRNYDGSGSDTKVRGSAQQVLDKYLALASDAALAGDRITAEGYHQHAEHYYRVLNPEQGADGGQKANQQEQKSHHQNKQRQRSENRAKPVEARVTPSEPVAELTQVAEVTEVADVTPSEPVAPVAELTSTETMKNPEEGVEEKPRRRGRPRKAEAAEPAA